MRPIDADALYKEIDEEYGKNEDGTWKPGIPLYVGLCLLAIRTAPTLEVEPVVRCIDCIHYESCKEVEGVSWTGFCRNGAFYTDEYEFCSRGARMDATAPKNGRTTEKTSR